MSSVKTLLVSFCFASFALGQEIGTEITPTTPTSGVKPATPAPNENPYAQPAQQPAQQPQTTQPAQQQPAQQKGGYVYRPQGQKAAPAPSAPSASSSPSSSGATSQGSNQGSKVSASSGDFGIRAGFGASGVVGLPSGTSTSTLAVGAPSVGISYFATDGFKLIFDVGFGLALITSSSAAAWALNANLGFDYLFRSPGDALRPLFHFAAQFSMAGAGSGDPLIGFGAELGGGAEYFFSPSFSVYGRIGLSVPMAAPGGNFILGIFTFTPGVGASFYF